MAETPVNYQSAGTQLRATPTAHRSVVFYPNRKL